MEDEKKEIRQAIRNISEKFVCKIPSKVRPCQMIKRGIYEGVKVAWYEGDEDMIKHEKQYGKPFDEYLSGREIRAVYRLLNY